MIDLALVLELLAMGAVVGFLAGLLGIGGGMLQVPILTYLLQQRGADGGLAVKMAIATSMATIAFTSISSLRSHHQRGAVRWDLVSRIAPGIIAGGVVAGAALFAVVKGSLLAGLFALFVGFSATQMLLDKKPKPARQVPGLVGTLSVGGAIGMLSGLVGAGGAFISVPFLTWCNVPVHQAVGTSAALGLPIALASTLGYIVSGWQLQSGVPGAFGYLWLPGLIAVSLMSVFTAPWGARVAHSMDVRRLKRAFAMMLYSLAAYMLVKAFA